MIRTGETSLSWVDCKSLYSTIRMENSSSSGASTVTPSSHLDLNPLCMCGVPCKIQTSWTEKNPGRRFFGCGKYGMLHHCQYFSWIDPETCDRSTKVMNGLLKKNQRLIREVEEHRKVVLSLSVEVKSKVAEVEKLRKMLVSYKNHNRNLSLFLIFLVFIFAINWNLMM